MRVGVYQHSTVGRDITVDILTALGADVVALGRANSFVPVDTEAIRDEDAILASDWASSGAFDAIVSMDGDADRPLVADEHGVWLRGDIIGVLCAKFLGVDHVVTPVSSNTVVEKSKLFVDVVRTRIGSPYVIEGMQKLLAGGKSMVAGYEANGGFLLASDVTQSGKILKALPTRDAMVVIIGVLALAHQSDVRVSSLAKSLPQRFTISDRLKDFPTDLSQDKLKSLVAGSELEKKHLLTQMFGVIAGQVSDIDQTDGLRVTFANQEVIHLRPSGNAPELRCYTEASTVERSKEINQLCMTILNTWR